MDPSNCISCKGVGWHERYYTEFDSDLYDCTKCEGMGDNEDDE